MAAIENLNMVLLVELGYDSDATEIVVNQGHWIMAYLNKEGGYSPYGIVIGCKFDTPEILEGSLFDVETGSFHREIGFFDIRDWRDINPIVCAGMALAWLSFGVTLIERAAPYQSAPETARTDPPEVAPF